MEWPIEQFIFESRLENGFYNNEIYKAIDEYGMLDRIDIANESQLNSLIDKLEKSNAPSKTAHLMWNVVLYTLIGAAMYGVSTGSIQNFIMTNPWLKGFNNPDSGLITTDMNIWQKLGLFALIAIAIKVGIPLIVWLGTKLCNWINRTDRLNYNEKNDMMRDVFYSIDRAIKYCGENGSNTAFMTKLKEAKAKLADQIIEADHYGFNTYGLI